MITREELISYRGPAYMRSEDYLYLPPDPRLKPYISHYTISFPTPVTLPKSYTILPSASTTLLFSASSDGIIGGLRGVNTRAGVVGGYASAFFVLVLIEFQPWGFYPFVKIPQQELTDSSFLFKELNPELYQELYDIMAGVGEAGELVNKLNQTFLRAAADVDISAPLLLAADQILKSGGLTNNRELVQQVCYSEKHLNRIFQQGIGMKVKTFSRIVRVNQALRLLESGRLNFTETAQQTGFYDQSHFNRDFKAVCGITPGEYLNNKSIFYNENYKL